MELLKTYKFFRFCRLSFLRVANWENCSGRELVFVNIPYGTIEDAIYEREPLVVDYAAERSLAPSFRVPSEGIWVASKNRKFTFNFSLLNFFKLVFNFKAEFSFHADSSLNIKVFFIKILFFFKRHFYKLKTKKFISLVKLITLGAFGLNLDSVTTFLSKLIVIEPRKKHKHIFQVFRSSPTGGTRILSGRVTILKGKTSWKALSRKKRIKKTRGISSITKFLFLTTFFSFNGRTATGVVNLSVNLFF